MAPRKTGSPKEGFDDLRSFIEFLKQTDRLVVVDKKVDSKYEAATVQMKILKELKKAVLFTNVDGKQRKMVGNLYTSRRMIADMFGVPPGKLVEKIMSFKSRKRFPVKVLQTGRCLQIVKKTFKDIRDIVPIPWNYQMDASYYITDGVAVLKDPETGRFNTAICRIMYRQGRLLNIYFAPMQHNWLIFNKYKALEKDMPIAVVIGADPVFLFASESNILMDEDEFEYAGAMKGGPLEVVRCQTVDLMVPENAEFVLEGMVSWNKTALEGPMGENQRVYGPRAELPLVKVSCITHREDPIYQNVLPGTVEEHSLICIPMEVRILEKLRRFSPHVLAVNLLPNLMNCFVQLGDYPPVQQGLGKNVLLEVLSDPWIKYAVVVDKDVNIDDPDEINWAISTRADLSKNLLVVNNIWGFIMDPVKKNKEDPVTKIGIDATVQPGEKERFLKADVAGYEKCDLKDYIPGGSSGLSGP